MPTKKARRRQRRTPKQEPPHKAVNRESWCGKWNARCIRADLWYRGELRKLGLWPPPPECMVFEPAQGI